MQDIRKTAVASMFYPEDSINLKKIVNEFISDVPEEIPEYFQKNGIEQVFGLIAPHAGYVYSGQVAAYAYSLIREAPIETVILIGPSHFNYFEGFALSSFRAFQTPMGNIPVDTEFTAKLAEVGEGDFDYVNTAHGKEHSLEVHLPFLSEVIDHPFKLVPILMGEQTIRAAETGAEVLYQILKDYDKRFLIVVSTDLSHYHTAVEAKKMDDEMIALMERMNTKQLMEEFRTGRIEACGMGPVCVLLELAKKMGHSNLKTLVYKNSGDTSGDYERVVGYTAAAIW